MPPNHKLTVGQIWTGAQVQVGRGGQAASFVAKTGQGMRSNKGLKSGPFP